MGHWRRERCQPHRSGTVLEFGEWAQNAKWSSEVSAWHWSGHEWSEEGQSDPWSSYLDSQRPGWNRRRYSNWATSSEQDSEGVEHTAEGREVPLPRLLPMGSLRETKPEDAGRRQSRAQWDDRSDGLGPGPRQDHQHPLHDHPQGV